MPGDTVNISIPTQLKQQADQLVQKGQYASFSDLARTAIRQLLRETQYDLILHQTKMELRDGSARALKTSKDVDSYIEEINR